MEMLQEGCQQLNIPLSPAQSAQFQRYYEILIEWNRKFNLTAITGYTEIQTKHFLDCLVALPIIAEELNLSLPIEKPIHLIDVGTGAGFPGIPLKIVCPDLKLTLIDGTGKKIQFLKHLVDELSLQDVTIVQGRAEELGRKAEYRGKFDLVTARAVAQLNTLSEYVLPLARLNGLTVIYKGTNTPQEFIAGKKAIDQLGGETVRLAPVQIPYLDEKRYIVLIKKVQRTPDIYPRGQGLARKRPLA